MLTILEGSTFCISDDRGDIEAATSGLFAHDTRFLSRLVLRVGGPSPLLLSSSPVEHFRAAFTPQRNDERPAARRDLDCAQPIRERGHAGTSDDPKQSPERLEIDVELEVESDFADIISVKLHDFSGPHTGAAVSAARGVHLPGEP